MNGSMGDSNNKKSFGLLIVISQTFSKEQKEHVLNKIKTSLIQNNDLSSSSIAINLEQELDLIIKSNPFDNKYNCDQEFCIKSKKENFQFELLINSTSNTFKQVLNYFLQSQCNFKSFIYAGVDQNIHANLIFQDSLFSFEDFLSLLNESKSLKTHEYNLNLCFNSKLINDNSNWKSLEKHSLNTKISIKLLSPGDIPQSTDSATPASSINIDFFIDYLKNYLNEKNICDFMEETKLTGTLNVEKPSLYIFPAKEGDCSFFTFNGYSMLINGGYDRVKPCFWKFTSMLKQIDSILITHHDTDAIAGLSSFFAKKVAQPSIKPNVISLFGNFVSPASKNHQSSDFFNDSCSIIDAAEKLKLKVQPLVKHEPSSIKHHQQPEHINLYYKFGYGSLDLYVLSPFANSNEYKEFIHQTKSSIHKSQLSVNQIFKTIPISHLCSAVVLLVWTPSKQNENALRMLFTGNAPQHVICHALDKVKDFDLLQVPLYKIKGETNQHATTISNKRPTAMNISANNSLNIGKDNKDSTKDVKDVASKDTNKSVTKANTYNPHNTTATTSAAENAKSNQTTNSVPSKANANGLPKQPPTSNGAKPPKPTNLQNGSSNGHKKEQANNNNASNEAKKADGVTNNKKVSTGKDSKEETKEKEESKDKDKEIKKTASTVSTKPVVAKKDEQNKSKTESTNTTRVSASAKSEASIKVSSSTVSSVSTTQVKRTSLAKAPNKNEKPEITKTEQLTTTTLLSTAVNRKSTAKTTKDNAETKDNKKEQTAFNKSSKSTTGRLIQIKDEKKTKPAMDDSKTSQIENAVKNINELKAVANSVSTADVIPIVDQEIVALSTKSDEDHETIVEKIEVHEVKNPYQEPIEHADKEAVEIEALVELKNSPSDPLDNEEVVRKEEIHQIESNFDNDFHSNEVETNIECEMRNCDQFEQNTEELNDIDKVEHFITNQNVEEHECEVNCDFGTEDDDNEIASDASPNLSPVKRAESKDSIELEENEACIAEIKNENIDENIMSNLKENLELCLGEGHQPQQQQTCLVDSEELIKTPQHSTEASPTEEIPPVDDIMTRSFIDNGTNNQNPFSVVNQDKKEDKIIDFGKETGDNESNVTPHLSQLENCTAVITEVDSLIDGFKTMNIEQQINHADNNNENLNNGDTLINGNHETNNLSAEVKQLPDQPINQQNANSDFQGEITQEKSIINDPNEWNLLSLPKPVNPNEENNSTATASALIDKKSTQNTKKNNPRSSSPSATPKSSNEINKSNQKGVSLNNSISKPTTGSSTKASGPVTKPSPPSHPLYFEVSYIPAHGNQYYVDSEFFKRVRARFYILSTIEPSQNILNALIEAKQTWEDKELQVSIIPTYESDVLRNWYELNSKTLANLKIDILPSANLTKLTIDENPEFSYQVYKLEF